MTIKLLNILFFLMVALGSFASHAENIQQKKVSLQKKIKSANTDLKNSRIVSKKLKNNVQVAEEKLNKISGELHQTEQDINRLTSKLTKSNAHKKKLLKQTIEQKRALAQQMQALYTSGKQSHLRLLLKQDDPSDISRTIKYFEYMNKSRLKRIQTIKKRLEKIKTVQNQINKDNQSLKELQVKQSKRKVVLKAVLKEKDRLLKNQGKIVSSKKQQLSKLKKDESRLRGLLKRLAKKQEKEEREEKARKLKKKTNVKKTKKTTKVVATVKRRFVPNAPFSSLRGKLSWPVRGKITHKYGSARNSKINWNGVIISASGGTSVHAVARGKVEFSGRWNGYGYIIIIRHDKNYRSLYAFNRAVYKKAGQVVKAGEVIAAVGNSGRLATPGLYFEISKGSIQQNPARWCR